MKSANARVCYATHSKKDEGIGAPHADVPNVRQQPLVQIEGQVNGVIRLVAADPAQSVAEITMASDTRTLKTTITFKSTETVIRNDEVNVIGNLTLTILERTAICCNSGEDYSGSGYVEKVRRNITHQIVFVFPRDQVYQPSTMGQLSATALIDVDNFPELPHAIYAANWLAVAQDEHCEMPGNIDEDYLGPSCRGTAPNGRMHLPGTPQTDWRQFTVNTARCPAT